MRLGAFVPAAGFNKTTRKLGRLVTRGRGDTHLFDLPRDDSVLPGGNLIIVNTIR